MSKSDRQILQLAAELGDPFGQEVDTVEYIAMELQISAEEVFEVFHDLLDPAE